MRTEINSVGFSKIFKAVNIKIQKKISRFVSDYCGINLKISVKECGVKELDGNKKIFIKYSGNECFFLFACEKIFARAIMDKFMEGEVLLGAEEISETEGKIFARGFSLDLISYYINTVLGFEPEKEEVEPTLSENPIEEFFDGEFIQVIYAEFETEINDKKTSFSFLFPAKHFKERFEAMDIKKIMEEKTEVAKINPDCVPINLRILFGKTRIKALDFSSLKNGDVIKLDKKAPSDVFVVFDNGFAIKGSLGKVKNKFAVKLNF